MHMIPEDRCMIDPGIDWMQYGMMQGASVEIIVELPLYKGSDLTQILHLMSLSLKVFTPTSLTALLFIIGSMHGLQRLFGLIYYSILL